MWRDSRAVRRTGVSAPRPSLNSTYRSRGRKRSPERIVSFGLEHEAGVEPACFGFKAQRGYRQPTARVLDQAAGIGPAWAAFRAQLGCQQPTPEYLAGR